ncbi:unnamed protein product [Lepidochelys kempii]
MRRISQISANVASKMQNYIKNSLVFSLALDESTEVQDKPQLAIFVRYVSADVIVKEEMLDLVALKETTRSVDIKNKLDKVLTNVDIPLDKRISVSMDGAPAMVGGKVGLIILLKSDPKLPEFLPVHCIIHHEHLTGR